MKSVNDGILVIDKPAGYTSRDIVNLVSKKLKIKKAGHTGTLDPMATGVLVICLGKATKLCEMLTSDVKEYTAKVTLGIKTDTLDNTGKVIAKKDLKISKEELEKVLNSFKKKYLQEVPLYSAVKVKGKKLYEYARAGIEVTLPKKEVEIFDIKLLDYNYPFLSFKCKVSKGTYIRALINDIASALNTYAVMSDLRRTKCGKFSIEGSTSLKDLENDNYNIISIKDVLDIPKIKVNDEDKFKIINGQKLDNKKEVLYLDKDNNVLAIYKDGKVSKMLY